ncbi:MAG: rod shape-determining protein [Rubripirellula sp.]|nr:rod shape-determining protein [Rubripirellula sp.]
MTSDIFYAGIDLGSMNSAAVASNSCRAFLPTTVGIPKDGLAATLLGDEPLVGESIEQHKMALKLVRPFQFGALKYGEQIADPPVHAVSYAKKVLRQLTQGLEIPDGQQVRCVMGAPSRSTLENKQTLLSVVREIMPTVALVPEPFAVAYGLFSTARQALIIDVGAGTTDLCHYYGAFPQSDDQATLAVGGDRIDQWLTELIMEEYPETEVTLEAARVIKEMHGDLKSEHGPCEVVLPTKDGESRAYDVSSALAQSCRLFADQLTLAVSDLLRQIPDHFRAEVLSNIVLAGGGSRLHGLGNALERSCSCFGLCKVSAIYDSRFAGADGALKLAMRINDDTWSALTQTTLSEASPSQTLPGAAA